MQNCTSPQIDNHANTPPLSFLQAGCVKALKAAIEINQEIKGQVQKLKKLQYYNIIQ